MSDQISPILVLLVAASHPSHARRSSVLAPFLRDSGMFAGRPVETGTATAPGEIVLRVAGPGRILPCSLTPEAMTTIAIQPRHARPLPAVIPAIDGAGLKNHLAPALGLALLLLPAAARAANPVVSNLSAAQRAGTHLVDITYDVTTEMPTVILSLEISSDGGTTFSVPATTAS